METKQCIIVRIGAHDADFTDVPPITGGDRKELFKQGLDLRKFSAADGFNPEEEARLILYFVRKVCPQATEAEVDALPSTIQQSILLHFVRASQAVKNPFVLPSSTSSPTSTAGG